MRVSLSASVNSDSETFICGRTSKSLIDVLKTSLFGESSLTTIKMVGCSMRNCKSRSVKGGTIRFFSFPLKESVANEWLRYCGPKTTTKNGKYLCKLKCI